MVISKGKTLKTCPNCSKNWGGGGGARILAGEFGANFARILQFPGIWSIWASLRGELVSWIPRYFIIRTSKGFYDLPRKFCNYLLVELGLPIFPTGPYFFQGNSSNSLFSWNPDGPLWWFQGQFWQSYSTPLLVYWGTKGSLSSNTQQWVASFLAYAKIKSWFRAAPMKSWGLLIAW